MIIMLVTLIMMIMEMPIKWFNIDTNSLQLIPHTSHDRDDDVNDDVDDDVDDDNDDDEDEVHDDDDDDDLTLQKDVC